MSESRSEQNMIITGNLAVNEYFGTVYTDAVSISFHDIPVLFPNISQFKKDVYIEANLKIGDMDVKKIIEYQAKEINDLKQKLEEIYYAPGMPGYIKAARNFEENKKRKLEY